LAPTATLSLWIVAVAGSITTSSSFEVLNVRPLTSTDVPGVAV
jgi:hypothetical protein